MRSMMLPTLAAISLLGVGWTPPAAAASHGRRGPSRECVPVAQLPIGLAATQTLRLNVTCLATSARPVAPCPATLRFVDDAGLPVAVDASPLERTTEIPVRGVASLDLAGESFVAPGTRSVVRAVVLIEPDDVAGDRVAMNVEAFDTATGRAAIRYAFEPCRTLPFAFVPEPQRPDGFPANARELSFAPPGITVDENVSLNVICNPDAVHPGAPCHVVLRYSPFETAASPPASPIAERDLSIPPGAIGSFQLSGDMLGATPGSRAMFRPSVVGIPATLGRLVTGLEIVDAATGVAHSLYQPPNAKQRLFSFAF